MEMLEDEDEPSPPHFPIPSSSLEIRLFYVRISPSSHPSPPSALSLALLPREPGAPLDLDGSRLPPSAAASLALPRHPPDLTFVSTRPLRLAGPLEFELRGDLHGDLLLCGSLHRVEPPWGTGAWTLHCHAAAAASGGGFTEVEVYVAGCCGGGPIMLTQTVQMGGRRKAARPGGLDVIPEDEVREEGKEKGLLCRRPMQLQLDSEGEKDEYAAKLSAGSGFYPEGAYYDEDGQLSWFNAGVRVGVGIGLGMCIGVGIGVGVLLRSYQATRNTFRRRFF